MDETSGAPGVAETQLAPGGEQPSTLEQALGAEGELIDEIERTLDSAGNDGPGQTAKLVELEELHGEPGGAATMRDLELLADVEVEVAVEFGRTRIPLRQLLTLRRGALVELGRRPEQHVSVLANGTPIALGDVVMVDDQIGVHIVELIDPRAQSVDPPVPSLPLADLHSEDVNGGPVGTVAASDGGEAPAAGDAEQATE